MLRNLYLAGLIFLFSLNSAFAQVGSGTLKGKLTDAETGEPLPFVNIVLQRGSQQIAGGATDFDGVYTIKPIPPGTYNVLVSYVGYNAKQVNGVVINGSKITFLDIPMESGIKLEEFEVVEYEVPLIDKDGGSSGGTVTRDDIAKMPGRDANSFAATVGGVQETADGISLRGAREGNTWYYIDGIKVRGSQNLPKAAIEEVSVITGGIPANYGDATGGIISITTRGATSQWFGGVDVITSGFANADGDGVGLDRYSQTQVEGVLSGPLIWKKNAEGEKIRPLVGFFVSANYRNFLDNRPTIGNFRLTDEAQNRLTNDPIDYVLNSVDVSPQNSFIIDDNGDIQQVVEINPQIQGNRNAEFLREDDWEEVPARQNDRQQGLTFTGKLDVAVNPNIDLSFGGQYDFVADNLYSYNNSLMNYQNNGESQNTNWRAFGRFTQRFENSEDDDGLVKNVFYSVMVDYSQRRFRRWDPTHEDRLFNYGYVGAFETTTTPNYVFNPDTLGGVFINQGDREIETTFTPSDINSDISIYTAQLFDFYEENGLTLTSQDEVDAAGAILNGRPLPSVYNLYNAIGAPFNDYTLFEQNQFRVSGSFSADVGDHAITFGLEYEQFTERNYNVQNPRDLWVQARNNTNTHLAQFDRSSDPEITQIGTNTFLTFDRRIDLESQTTFDRNLRLALGLDPNGADIINVDGLDPDFLSLDMFSPDELFVTGGNSSVVNYYGYDHTGERLTGSRPTIDDFFNERDENGMLTRPIGAFQPIYAAGYIMDKFAFDDIIFNVGLRVDLFDANQPVLKDQFVIGDAATVDDTRNASAENDRLAKYADQHPGVVQGDWVVYVDDVTSDTQINGYRDGNTWYNASGVEIPDPRVIRGTSGIAPLLIDPEAVGENLNGDAFEDYEQQINVMPRISFSFPISDEAVFFAHYDILTQRPLNRNVVNPLDYLFIQDIGNLAVNNPNLRPTRTTDYELGFQQVLSRSSSLKIAAFYRDTKDEVQARQLLEAFPVTYTSFDNFDFGTTQGLTLTYDLRRTGNVTLKVAYTLQFAEATGSNSTSAINLVNSGEPNLRVIFPTDRDQRHLLITTFDYRYGSGKDYNGPVIGGKQIFANAGLNLVGTFGSGTPYSRQQLATGTQLIGNSTAPQLEGTVNGSRLPSQFRVNLQIDKSWNLSLGKEGEKQKQALLNVYLLVNNLLNAQNIIGAYRFTGNPDDDGYLSSPQFTPAINNQIDPDSFRQLYALKVANPFNYTIPRTIQLGVRLDF